MASRGVISKNDGSFKSVSIEQSLHVRNKITANKICTRHIASNTLKVVGDSTLLNLKVSEDATVCGDLTVSGNTEVNNLLISGTITITGDLFVKGNTTLGDTLFVSGNTTLQGDLLVCGDTTLKQDLYISGNTTLQGDLFVKGNTTLNQNLYVSGNTTLQDLQVNGNTTLLGDLYVTGNTTLQSDLLVCGDTTLKQDLYVSGGITINQNLKVNGDVSICGDLVVQGNTTLHSDLLVQGNTTLQGDLLVQGNTTLQGDLLVKGNTTLAQLYVSGNTTLQGDLEVNGTVTLQSDLYVSGNTTLHQDLIVCGDTTLKQDFLVKGDTTLEGNLYVSSDATIQGNLKVQGDASLCSNLVVGMNSTLDGVLKVRGNTSLCSDAEVGQDLLVQRDVHVVGNTTLDGNLYVDNQVTFNRSLKVSGSATFCDDVLVTGATLTTDDICVGSSFTLFSNSIAPKTGTQVTVGGAGDSVMVDRVVTRYIDGKFGGSVTIATGVNVIGDLTVTGVICSTLPTSIVESNTVRSKSFSTTLVLGTAGQPKVVCVAQGNTLQADSIEAKSPGGLLICATTLQAKVLLPKVGTSLTLGNGGDTVNIADNVCVLGSVITNQISPKTGTGFSLGTGGDLIQVRDDMCVDGFLQTLNLRAKENSNLFNIQRINGSTRATVDISDPELKIITPEGISLCPGNGFVQIEGTLIVNGITLQGGSGLTICASQINADRIGSKSSQTIAFQNNDGTRETFLNFFDASGPQLVAGYGSLRLESIGTGEIHVEGPMQTRRLEPDVTNTRDIGTSALRYQDIFAKTVNTGLVTGPAASGITLNANDGAIRLTRSGAGDVVLTTAGANELHLSPGGTTIHANADLCVTGTLAVDYIINKTGSGLSICADTLQVNTVQAKTSNTINVQTNGAADTLRFALGAASGPLISSQSGQPLRLSGGPSGGITLEDNTTTRDLIPNTTGNRDIGTAVLRYNQVFANEGDFDTHVNTPLLQNTLGPLELQPANGIVELDRVGAGAITLNSGHHIDIQSNGNGITLIGGPGAGSHVEVRDNLCVLGDLLVNSIDTKPPGNTLSMGIVAFDNIVAKDPSTLVCVGGTLAVDKIQNKTAAGLTIDNTSIGSAARTTIQLGDGSNFVVGRASTAVSRSSGCTDCGAFMGQGNSITGISSNSAVLGGMGITISGAANSVIAGGMDNRIIAGNQSFIAAGRGCTIQGANSMIMGQFGHVKDSHCVLINCHDTAAGTLRSNSVERIFMDATNDIFVYCDINFSGGTGVVVPSDQKKKEDIVDLSLGLTDVLQLTPREFYFKDRNYSVLGEPKKTGFVAQELEAVHPRLVLRESNRQRKVAYLKRVADLEDKTPLPEELYNMDTLDSEEEFGVDYASFIPILTQAIKDQHVLIVDLQERVAALETAE